MTTPTHQDPPAAPVQPDIDDDLDEPLGAPACNLDGEGCESCQ